MPSHTATINFEFPDQEIEEPLKTQIAHAMRSAVQGVLDTHMRNNGRLVGTAAVMKADCCQKGQGA